MTTGKILQAKILQAKHGKIARKAHGPPRAVWENKYSRKIIIVLANIRFTVALSYAGGKSHFSKERKRGRVVVKGLRGWEWYPIRQPVVKLG